MLAYSFSGTFSILLTVIRAYSFIKSLEKVLPTHLLETYSFIIFPKIIQPTRLLEHTRLLNLKKKASLRVYRELSAYLKFIYSEKATKFCEIFP